MESKRENKDDFKRLGLGNWLELPLVRWRRLWIEQVGGIIEDFHFEHVELKMYIGHPKGYV